MSVEGRVQLPSFFSPAKIFTGKIFALLDRTALERPALSKEKSCTGRGGKPNGSGAVGVKSTT
jgi:hypothetical protein